MSGFFNGLKNALSSFDQYSPAAQSKGRLDIAKQQEQIEEQEEERQARQSDLEFHQHLSLMGAQPVVNGLVKRNLPGPDGNGGQMNATLIDKADPARTIKFKDATGDQVEYELPTLAEQLSRQFAAQHDPQLIAQQHAAEEAEATHNAQLQQLTRNLTGTPLVGDNGLFTPEMGAKLGLNPNATLRLLPTEALGEIGKVTAPTIQAGSRENIATQNNQTKTDIATGNRQSREDVAAANRAAAQTRLTQTISDRDRLAADANAIRDAASRRSAAATAGFQPDLSPVQLHTNAIMQEADKQRGMLNSAADLLDENKVKDGDTFTNPFTNSQMEMNPGVRQMLGDRANLAVQRVDELHHAAATAAGAPPPQPAPQPAAAKPQAQNNPNADHTYDSVPADIRPMVSAIVEGREQGLTGRAAISGRGARIMNAVNQFDPDWSAQRAEIRKSFALDKNIGANNTAVVHLDQLGDAAEALGNGSFRPGNAIYQTIRNTFGSDAPTDFEGIKAAVAGEMASALKGNATDPEIASMKANIDKSSSPQQLKGIIQENLKILGAKLNTYQERYSQQIPNDKKWSPVLPSARAVFAKHGINPAAGPAAVNQPTGGNNSQYRAGDKRTINGTVYIRDDKGTWSPQ